MKCNLWSPGLAVKGGDSESEGCSSNPRRQILDGHFVTFICCKNCNVCLNKTKVNDKEAGVGPFLNVICTELKSNCKKVSLYWYQTAYKSRAQ